MFLFVFFTHTIFLFFLEEKRKKPKYSNNNEGEFSAIEYIINKQNTLFDKMDYAEEQSGEIEALEAIYSEELTSKLIEFNVVFRENVC